MSAHEGSARQDAQERGQLGARCGPKSSTADTSVTEDAPWSHKYAEACVGKPLPRLDRAKAEASGDALEAAYALGAEAAAKLLKPSGGVTYR